MFQVIPISGDSFRSISHFHFDQFLDFDPAKVMRGDIVFVRSNFLHDFFADVHPHINEPYVLISHNEDSTVGPEFETYIDDKILQRDIHIILFITLQSGNR